MPEEVAQPEVITESMTEQIFSDEPILAPKENSKSNGSIDLDSVKITGGQESTAEPTGEEPVKSEESPKPDFDINGYVKENFGFDNPDVAKEQIEKWRKAESEPKPEPQKMQFANPDSEMLYLAFQAGETDKVLNILQKQQELTKANELAPLEQIRLELQYANPKYSKEDIDDIIEEKYGLPEKDFDEYDDDYEDRKKAYDKQAAKVERRIKRDADVAYENLQKYKNDLLLSDIKTSAEQYQNFLQEQQELQQWEEQAHKSYLDALDRDYSGFKGFNTGYKDKEVDVPVEYKPTEQELKDLKNKFSYGFDADDYFANRWINIEGDKVVGFKVADQMADIYLLENKQKIFDKIATDAANRALDAYQRAEKNIDFRSQGSRAGSYEAAKTADQLLTDKLWQ